MQEATHQDHSISTKLLKFYSGYRVFLGALILWLGYLESAPAYFGSTDSNLFSLTTIIYLAIAVISLPLFFMMH